MKRIKITYACDYCGGVINPDETIAAIIPGRIGYAHKFIANHDEDGEEVLHYHDYCMENLLTMKYKGAEVVEEPEADPEPKQELKKPVKGKPVDTGKIKALAKAGWSAKKISDEMGISPSAVYNHLKKIREGA